MAKQLLVLAVAAFCAIGAVQSACCPGPLGPCQGSFAFGPGEDVCSKLESGDALVVRPQILPKPPALKVTPLPGPCSCTKAIVKPAIVPAPPQAGPCCGPNPVAPPCCGAAGCGCSSCASTCSSNLFLGGLRPGSTPPSQIPSDCRPIQYPINYIPPGAPAAPADPVSLSIAYKLAQQNCIRGEDKLSFGFTKLPKELPPVVKAANNIPEEKLYKLNGQIVELKPITCQNKKTLEEEAAEELLSLSDEVVEPSEIRKVSYGELGYAPAKIAAVPFVNVAVANPTEVQAEAALATSCPCNDGFVPGSVTFQTNPRPQPTVIMPPAPCESLEDYNIPAPASLTCGSCFCTGGAKSSKKNILFQKLSGCL